jgi:hypothetical protein
MNIAKREPHVAVISTDRPNNVPRIKHVLQCEPTFYVTKGEEKFYQKCGALHVVGCDRNISAARNRAMNDAAEMGRYGVQVSDDLKGIEIAMDRHRKVKATFAEVCEMIFKKMREEEVTLAGVAITGNLFYYTGTPWVTDKLVVNDMIFTIGNDIQYDEKAALKEDYDMFVMQMMKNGKVLRANHILCNFPHRGNAGGANVYRTKLEEQLRNEYVMKKHKGIIVPHKSRLNQVEINYKLLKERMA